MECGQVNMVEETDLDLVDFITMVSDVKLNRFICNLPSSIRLITKDDESDETDRNNNRKKRKQPEKSSTKIVTNENVDQDWKLMDNEPWHSEINLNHYTK